MKKEILNIVYALSALLISTSVFYYLVFFRPQIDRATLLSDSEMFKASVLCEDYEKISGVRSWTTYCNAVGIKD